MYWTVLCCTVLYCVLLDCIVLYCVALYCILLYCIVLCCVPCILLYCIVLYCVVCKLECVGPYLCFLLILLFLVLSHTANTSRVGGAGTKQNDILHRFLFVTVWQCHRQYQCHTVSDCVIGTGPKSTDFRKLQTHIHDIANWLYNTCFEGSHFHLKEHSLAEKCMCRCLIQGRNNPVQGCYTNVGDTGAEEDMNLMKWWSRVLFVRWGIDSFYKGPYLEGVSSSAS